MDSRAAWGGTVSGGRKLLKKRTKRASYYKKRSGPGAIIKGERLRVAARILASLGKG